MNLKSHSWARLAAAAFALSTTTALVVAPQPAMASSHRPCTIVKHSNTSGVTRTGHATATVVADGVKLTTAPSENDDQVSWKSMFPRPVPANTVTEVSYETQKLDTAGAGVNDAALPGYVFYVHTPAGDGNLVYEPYYYTGDLGVGNPQRRLRTEWNVLDGKLWTSSHAINQMDPTAGGPPTKTFAQVVADNPKMTVTGIGFNLGTYNTGVISVLDEQRFATRTDCTEHQWSTGFSTGIWWPWSLLH
jgi:hypothetical protein